MIRSQMINQEDYTMIADYDCMGKDERGKILEQKGDQVRKGDQEYIVINVTSWFKPVTSWFKPVF